MLRQRCCPYFMRSQRWFQPIAARGDASAEFSRHLRFFLKSLIRCGEFRLSHVKPGTKALSCEFFEDVKRWVILVLERLPTLRGHGGKLSRLPLNIRLLRYTKSSVHVFSIGKVRIFLAIIPSCHVPATSARAECGAAGNVTYAPAQTIAPPAPDASPVRTSNVLGAGDVKEHGNREPTVNRLPLLATGHTNLRSS